MRKKTEISGWGEASLSPILTDFLYELFISFCWFHYVDENFGPYEISSYQSFLLQLSSHQNKLIITRIFYSQLFAFFLFFWPAPILKPSSYYKDPNIIHISIPGEIGLKNSWPRQPYPVTLQVIHFHLPVVLHSQTTHN